MLSDATEDAALPVKLSNFDAFFQDGNITLEWQTESELQNSHWIIEKKCLSWKEYDLIEQGELLINYPFCKSFYCGCQY